MCCNDNVFALNAPALVFTTRVCRELCGFRLLEDHASVPIDGSGEAAQVTQGMEFCLIGKRTPACRCAGRKTRMTLRTEFIGDPTIGQQIVCIRCSPSTGACRNPGMRRKSQSISSALTISSIELMADAPPSQMSRAESFPKVDAS